MKRQLVRLVLVGIVLGLVFAPLVALGQEGPCRREGDRVTCDAGSFKLLTDSCTQFKADAKTCALRLEDAKKDIAATEFKLGACQAALAAVPPPEPPRSATRQLSGYGIGIASTALVLSSVLLPVPNAARFALVGVGVVGLGGGVILVLP